MSKTRFTLDPSTNERITRLKTIDLSYKSSEGKTVTGKFKNENGFSSADILRHLGELKPPYRFKDTPVMVLVLTDSNSVSVIEPEE